jgi:hypothetical protein
MLFIPVWGFTCEMKRNFKHLVEEILLQTCDCMVCIFKKNKQNQKNHEICHDGMKSYVEIGVKVWKDFEGSPHQRWLNIQLVVVTASSSSWVPKAATMWDVARAASPLSRQRRQCVRHLRRRRVQVGEPTVAQRPPLGSAPSPLHLPPVLSGPSHPLPQPLVPLTGGQISCGSNVARYPGVAHAGYVWRQRWRSAVAAAPALARWWWWHRSTKTWCRQRQCVAVTVPVFMIARVYHLALGECLEFAEFQVRHSAKLSSQSLCFPSAWRRVFLGLRRVPVALDMFRISGSEFFQEKNSMTKIYSYIS